MKTEMQSGSTLSFLLQYGKDFIFEALRQYQSQSITLKKPKTATQHPKREEICGNSGVMDVKEEIGIKIVVRERFG